MLRVSQQTHNGSLKHLQTHATIGSNEACMGTDSHCHAEMQAILRMNEEYNKWRQYNSGLVLMYHTRVGIN